MKTYYTSFKLGSSLTVAVHGINLSTVFEEFDEGSSNVVSLQPGEELVICGYHPEAVTLVDRVRAAVEAAGIPFGFVGEEDVVYFDII
jgi:hypothetical protein